MPCYSGDIGVDNISHPEKRGVTHHHNPDQNSDINLYITQRFPTPKVFARRKTATSHGNKKLRQPLLPASSRPQPPPHLFPRSHKILCAPPSSPVPLICRAIICSRSLSIALLSIAITSLPPNADWPCPNWAVPIDGFSPIPAAGETTRLSFSHLMPVAGQRMTVFGSGLQGPSPASGGAMQ